MFPERDRQDDCVGLECIPQRLGDDRGSNRPSLRRQRLGRPAARDGHIDVFTGEGVSEGLAYLPESYNRIAHISSPIRVDIDIDSTAFNGARLTPLMLDVTNAEQIEQAVRQVGSLDVLINNSGIAPYDDLSDPALIEQTLAVNFFGMYKVSRAFLPMLKRSKGAIVNNLSLMALAPLPLTPSYAISKAAALSMTQSLRALLASEGVTVHGVFLGPVDTDMTRGFEIPKASPESVAQGIFDGLQNGEEDIFPDAMSQSIAEGWRTGVAKEFERQYAGFVPQSAVAL